jgi:hypothetical protein
VTEKSGAMCQLLGFHVEAVQVLDINVPLVVKGGEEEELAPVAASRQVYVSSTFA